MAYSQTCLKAVHKFELIGGQSLNSNVFQSDDVVSACNQEFEAAEPSCIPSDPAPS